MYSESHSKRKNLYQVFIRTNFLKKSFVHVLPVNGNIYFILPIYFIVKFQKRQHVESLQEGCDLILVTNSTKRSFHGGYCSVHQRSFCWHFEKRITNIIIMKLIWIIKKIHKLYFLCPKLSAAFLLRRLARRSRLLPNQRIKPTILKSTTKL